MNLQAELRTVEDDVKFSFWTLIGFVQRNGLFRDAPGVFYHLQFVNQLVSFVLPLAAIRIRI